MRSNSLNLLTSEAPIRDEKEVSFRNYKINYTRPPLGSGVFGTVYEVSPRPENEKGFLSYWFPYIYDYAYPANIGDVNSTKYCVKIFKSSFRILQENLEKPLPLQYPIMSFFERSNEKKSNALLQKHGITKVHFFKTNGFYSQFKTIVHGKTFQFYVDKNFFTLPDQFILRKSFITFLRLVMHSKLKFEDVHSKNIMYDEKEKRWDIIDGDVIKNDKEDYNFPDDLIFYTKNKTHETEYMLKTLIQFAKDSNEYTIEIDADFLTKMASGKEVFYQNLYTYK